MSELYPILRALKMGESSGGGSGFTPTQAQLDAMNSGIDSEKVAQIGTNENNILSVSEIVVDDSAKINGGFAEITDITWNEGYYVNNVQDKEVALSGYKTSELITLEKGETIRISNAYSATTDVVDLLSLWATSEIYTSSIKSYNTAEIKTYEYTATNEIEYIKVCSSTTSGIKVSKYTNGLIASESDLKSDVLSIHETSPSLSKETADVVEVEGYFINNVGSIVANTGYAYTQSYELNKGESVEVTSSDASGSNVSRVSLWTASGTYIKTVDYGTTTVSTFRYTATTEKEFVRFSYSIRRGIKIDKIAINIPDTFKMAVNLTDDTIYPYNSYIDFSISMFETVGFCGDSYVKGQLYNSQGLIGDKPNLAWGSCLGRIEGIDAHIYASSGANTNTWQSRQDCLPLVLSDTARGLYIFCLGINDASYVSTGTIDDIKPDYHNNPNTFYGNYGKIIEQIQEHAPNSKIIIMTPYLLTYANQYKIPIQEITEHYGIAMIDTTESVLCSNPSFSSLLVNGHPTAPLHSAMANDIAQLIRKCISENYNYFKDYAGL